MTRTEIQKVMDEQGAHYELKKEIGEGGQGSVWETQYDKILVKRFRKISKEQRDKIYRRMKYVMLRTDLPDQEIATPKAFLADPDSGYVMELMDEMVSMGTLIKPTRQKDVLKWYKESGAIRRRIQLLHRLSRTLVDLHSAGFVFGDLSPSNIFVSEDSDHNEVQLIDCDNLVLISESDSKLHTPRYAAPELVRGERVHTSMTDAYSFASVAYELLTLNHPLIGDFVANGDPELEEQAFRGELPWVEDEEDDRNAHSGGLPSDKVIFPSLKKLFIKTFSGTRDPWLRPSMQEWHEALEYVLHGFLKCDYCGSYFPYNKDYICPFCYDENNPQKKDRGNLLILRFMRWEPEAEVGKRILNLKELHLPTMILNKGETIEIPSSLSFWDKGSIQFSFEEDTLYVELKGSEDLRVVNRKMIGNDIDEGQSRSLKVGKRLPIKQRNEIFHFGDLEKPHRIVAFYWGQK